MSLPISSPGKKTAPNVEKNMEKIQGIVICLLAVGFVMLQVFPQTVVEVSVSLLILAVIVGITPMIRGSTLTICLVLLFLAVGLMLYHNASPQEWLQAMRVNITLVALFLFAPLLGIPVRTGGYVEALKIVLSRKMNDPHFFFLGSKLLTHVLGVVINIGSVSIVYQLMKASTIKTPRLMANAINRGFISSIFWSPYFSAMALILSQLPIAWTSIVIYMLGLALISLLVSFLIERPLIESMDHSNGRKTVDDYEDKELRKAKRKVVELFFLLFLIMAVVLLLEAVISSSIVLIICLVSVVFPVLWCFLTGKRALYREEIKEHIFVGIPRMKKEIVLFLIAGFFSGAFLHSELSGQLVELINGLFGNFTIGIAFFLSLLIVLSAVVGLHPIVVVTILVTSIKPELIGLSPEYFAVLLLASWGISNTVSPATAVNNLLASLLKVDVFELSIRWNFKFVIIMLFLIPIYLEITGL
ncbi:hypothetical protein ACFFIX_18000 [Metabacillus herbersteinensis]|uniref:Citrate transporter-like domain-containing protein n=1 Tax=Metabacillus herbersteinensis TaxID=283816 RepID=A0ABV6GIA7_9BACI